MSMRMLDDHLCPTAPLDIHQSQKVCTTSIKIRTRKIWRLILVAVTLFFQARPRILVMQDRETGQSLLLVDLEHLGKVVEREALQTFREKSL